MARGARRLRSWFRPVRPRRGSTGRRTTWSSPGSGRSWRPAARAGTGTSGLRPRRGRRRGLPRRGCPARRGGSSFSCGCSRTPASSGLPNAGKSSLLARAHQRAPEGRGLSVHDGRSDPGHDRRLRAPAGPRRHPGPDRGGGVGRRDGARVPRARRALPGARALWSRSIRPMAPAARPRRTGRCGTSWRRYGAGLAELPELVAVLEDRPAAAGGARGVGRRARERRSARSRRARGLVGDRRGDSTR